MNYKKLFTTVLLAIALQSPAQEQMYVGGDISLLPTYEENGANYMDVNGTKITNMLAYLKQQGWNALRVRLFVDPAEKFYPFFARTRKLSSVISSCWHSI